MMRRIASTGGDWAPRCRRRLGGGAEARCPGPSPPAPRPGPPAGKFGESVHNGKFRVHSSFHVPSNVDHAEGSARQYSRMCGSRALLPSRSVDRRHDNLGRRHTRNIPHRIHIHTTGRRPRTITSHPHKVTDTYVQMWHHSRVNSESGTTLQGGESCSHASRRL